MINRYVLLAFLLGVLGNVNGEPVSSSMNEEMTLADSIKSKSKIPQCETPLAVFRKLYSTYTTGRSRDLCQLLTTSGTRSMFGSSEPKEDDFLKRDQDWKERAPYQLNSFSFSNDSQHVEVTFKVDVNGKNPMGLQIEVTMVDSPSGWLIDKYYEIVSWF